MKREIISGIAGAAIASVIWLTLGIQVDMNEEVIMPQAELVEADVTDSSELVPILDKDIQFSSVAQGNFPGLKLYNTDFLVPLNRVILTKYVYFDDPEENYGTAGAPGFSFMFAVSEKGKDHYFLTSALQGNLVNELVYLGENIDIKEVKDKDGWHVFTYMDKNGKNGEAAIGGQWTEDPVNENGISQSLVMDFRWNLLKPYDPEYFNGDFDQFFQKLQNAVRQDDKAAVAGMIEFPIAVDHWKYYTRKEFIADYDEIFNDARKKELLDSKLDDVFFSWRGALIPGEIWCTGAPDKETSAPIDLIH
ncbi:MAG: hypothetical protein J5773_05765 [Verrucomicrobia bacterium]|nr:hypothetical protein [Verrucomicrobiota bacterium]